MIMLKKLVVFLPFLVGSTSADLLPESLRVDCAPDDPEINELSCLDRGCSFAAATTEGPPSCYYPENFGYKLYGQVVETEAGFTAELFKSGPPSFAPEEFNLITLDVECQTENRLRIKIHPNVPRYEVPIEIPSIPPKPLNALYSVEFSDDPVFSFRVIRKASGTVIFDSSLGGLTLANQFLQIASFLPSEYVYGLGEHEHSSLKHSLNWTSWAIFAHNHAPDPELALYGAHPHYTVVEDDGSTHSVLFKNSNAQEVVFTPAPGLIYRTIGGVIDIYFFMGPNPEDAVQQYTEAVGRHLMPAYWTLGYHQCRWRYDSLDNMRAAYDRTVNAGIPFEAQWGDIDVLDRRLDFTYDEVNFAGLPEFIDELHANDRRFVIILDPAIAIGEPQGSYPAFEDGEENGVWITDASGNPLEGYVWPDDPTYFPDFTNPATTEWWTRSLTEWRQTIQYDGLWIDMNEPTSFINGSTSGCELNQWNMPPYLPKFGRDRIYYKTICMDSVQKGGLHYDLHSMYGWWEAVATRKAIDTIIGERGISMSRSTFPGANKYASHWLGDNWSDWYNMKASLIGIMEFNQFGFPLVGADICGFFLNTTEELCARWHLVGSFYPFSRNHNERYSLDQDPGLWHTVADNARKTLLIKYSLLPHLYTLFYHHAKSGNTVVRPIWHEFPTDKAALEIDEQFLWGSSFMVSPVLYEGKTDVTVYFPQSLWYDYFTRSLYSSGGESISINCPLDCIPLHIRGGSIIVTQPPEMTTTATRLNNFELIATLDENNEASGELYWDDGISLDPDLVLGSLIQYTIVGNQLSSQVNMQNYEFDLKVTKVSVWGVSGVKDLFVNNGTILCDWSNDDSVLDIDCGNQLQAMQDWNIQWS